MDLRRSPSPSRIKAWSSFPLLRVVRCFRDPDFGFQEMCGRMLRMVSREGNAFTKTKPAAEPAKSSFSSLRLESYTTTSGIFAAATVTPSWFRDSE